MIGARKFRAMVAILTTEQVSADDVAVALRGSIPHGTVEPEWVVEVMDYKPPTQDDGK